MNHEYATPMPVRGPWPEPIAPIVALTLAVQRTLGDISHYRLVRLPRGPICVSRYIRGRLSYRSGGRNRFIVSVFIVRIDPSVLPIWPIIRRCNSGCGPSTNRTILSSDSAAGLHSLLEFCITGKPARRIDIDHMVGLTIGYSNEYDASVVGMFS